MPVLYAWKHEELQRLKEESDFLLNHLCSHYGLPSVCQATKKQLGSFMVHELPQLVRIEVALPNINVRTLDIVATKNMLAVRYDLEVNCTCRNSEHRFASHNAGRFVQRIPLPSDCILDESKAEYINGVLHILLPIYQRPAMRRIPVTFFNE